jgi:hypothetical protein
MKASSALLGVAAVAMLAYSAGAAAQSGEIEISAFERITGLPPDEPLYAPPRPQPKMLQAFDLVLVRPFGVVATVLGAGMFAVVVGPATLAEGHFPDDLAQGAVMKPFNYTFRRPLGDTKQQ